MRTFEVKIPKSANDLRIKHYGIFKDGSKLIDQSMNGKIEFISKLTGLHLSELRILSQKQVDEIWKHAVVACSGLTIGSEPPQEIVMDGITFELINPKKVGIGWHIDFGAVIQAKLIENDPLTVACLFYHPKGHIYGEVDVNKNIIHSIEWKKPIFEEHFQLRTFLESSAFFLNWWQASTMKSTVKGIATNHTIKVVNKMRGSLGKEPLTI